MSSYYKLVLCSLLTSFKIGILLSLVWGMQVGWIGMLFFFFFAPALFHLAV